MASRVRDTIEQHCAFDDRRIRRELVLPVSMTEEDHRCRADPAVVGAEDTSQRGSNAPEREHVRGGANERDARWRIRSGECRGAITKGAELLDGRGLRRPVHEIGNGRARHCQIACHARLRLAESWIGRGHEDEPFCICGRDGVPDPVDRARNDRRGADGDRQRDRDDEGRPGRLDQRSERVAERGHDESAGSKPMPEVVTGVAGFARFSVD